MNIRKYIFGIVVFLLALTSCNSNDYKESSMAGYTLGTTYHIKYLSESDLNLQDKVDSLYAAIIKSMSTYDPNSDISKINKGDSTVVVDHMFIEVYNASKKVWSESDGMFDPTIGVMVNAWGFGPKNELSNLSKNKIARLMKSVGLEKTRIMANGLFVKDNPKTEIDFNAIAKGYTLDRVAVLLEENGINNYLIEIGGEIVAKGKKLDGELWRIGIDDPKQSLNGERHLTAILELSDRSMATSGNYRRFRVDSLTGEKYVHTINAKTGMAKRSNMLSASVIAENCTYADAYATTFMAMGLETTLEFLKKHDELDVYLIYVDEEGEMKSYMSEQFKNSLRSL